MIPENLPSNSPKKPLPKIHFVSLFSPNNDLDMAEEFASHYGGLDFDSRTVFLHELGNIELFQIACDIFTDYNFTIFPVSKSLPFDNGNLRHRVLDKFRKSLPGLDYMWTADADEIQNVINIREVLDLGSQMPAHVLMGRCIDCFDYTLHDHIGDNELQDDFPYLEDNLYEKIFPGRRQEQEKVVAARAWLPVDLNGSHKIFPFQKPNVYRMRDGIEIFHYRWRESMLKKFENGFNYINQKAGDKDRLLQFFKG